MTIFDNQVAIDAINLAQGAYAPLDGFSSLGINGYPIPIVCPVTGDPPGVGDKVGICFSNGRGLVAVLTVTGVDTWRPAIVAQAVCGTDSEQHPGFVRMAQRSEVLLYGSVKLCVKDWGPNGPDYTKGQFERKGWQTVCAFQTRNAPHIGHEHLINTVLGLVDGVFVQPVLGEKKDGDYTDEAIFAGYRALLDNYFPADRVLLGALPYNMWYAGPREAIHHALIRRNYGCTHIIIGRDHAGVGDFYDDEAAINEFDRYDNLGIEPIFIRGDFWWCDVCGGVQSNRTCPHGEDDRLPFSGTRLRKQIAWDEQPVPELMRPEVYHAIRDCEQIFA